MSDRALEALRDLRDDMHRFADYLSVPANQGDGEAGELRDVANQWVGDITQAIHNRGRRARCKFISLDLDDNPEDEYPITIHVEGRRWFDRTYGNTYHSVKVYADGETVGVVGMSYGYGDQYLETAYELLQRKGVLPFAEGMEVLWQVCRDLGIKLTTSVSDGLKRDLHKEGDE